MAELSELPTERRMIEAYSNGEMKIQLFKVTVDDCRSRTELFSEWNIFHQQSTKLVLMV